MANKKKRNSNYKNTPVRSVPQTITVREKKRQLIRERIHPDAVKMRGMRALSLIASVIMISRAALFVYELVFFSLNKMSVSVISNLLLLPLLLICIMAHDGNRGLLGVSAISAIGRIIYLFASLYPEIEGKDAWIPFAAVYALVMALQFIMSTVALSMPSTDAYSKEMQKINFELRSYLMNTRR